MHPQRKVDLKPLVVRTVQIVCSCQRLVELKPLSACRAQGDICHHGHHYHLPPLLLSLPMDPREPVCPPQASLSLSELYLLFVNKNPAPLCFTPLSSAAD